ncbi:MAG: hypothetical protein QM581_11420 [Pseudomonas sp.]
MVKSEVSLLAAGAAGCCDIAGMETDIATIISDAAAPRIAIFIRCDSWVW